MYPVGRGMQRPIVMRSFPGVEAAPTFLGVPLARLDAMDAEEFDALPFGVIGMAPGGAAEVYNAHESSMAGLKPDAVLGRPFLLSVGVCMNNFLIAQRFEDEPELDAVLDYVLTFRMRPTPVRLRLLKGAAARRRFILVQR